MRHDDRKPEEIRADVDRVRRELDSTIVAIEQRLSPQRLADRGIDYLRHSGAREFAANLGESVKHNPLAVVLVGVGLAWLMANRNGFAAGRVAHAGESQRSALDRASGAVAATRERISRTTEAARERFDDARETIAHIEESARRQMERARAGYDHVMREQPLTLGFVGLALGAIAAAGIPRTREEDALMGEARDRLAQKAAAADAVQVANAQHGLEAANQARRSEEDAHAVETSLSGL